MTAATEVAASWTIGRFFGELRELSPLRVITIAGPSVFESICSVGPFGVSEGHLNAITDAYHWHLDVRRTARLRSHDSVHARSGRRVLFFELLEQGQDKPFVSIYLHRAKNEEFGDQRLARFDRLHRELQLGLELESSS
jgi:hypothetical protein